ncbi:MAG: hypothetical protein PHH71_03665 [Clostridia bacterium]|jgi:hypothetical protein|nr:hypothetical protein [Clostridia bacterium]MDD2227654.1 hypothetical protein [Clostridia bacterium]MDD3232266.1 hypothetical protein [Clostridia bacterium]MDD3862560.1 hypothetical protein [Clostridia bacterium]MDD4409018.1 hypothetical protein [Clostridia bacterium]
MKEIDIKMFTGRTEARLVKLRYDVLPIAMNTTVNITNEDEIVITRVDDRAISFEVTRNIVVNPKSLFEISATCYLRRSIGEQFQNLVSLKSIDINKFVNDHLADLTNIAFCNLAYIFGSITGSFGGTPLLTPPAPMKNTNIRIKD